MHYRFVIRGRRLNQMKNYYIYHSTFKDISYDMDFNRIYLFDSEINARKFYKEHSTKESNEFIDFSSERHFRLFKVKNVEHTFKMAEHGIFKEISIDLFNYLLIKYDFEKIKHSLFIDIKNKNH